MKKFANNQEYEKWREGGHSTRMAVYAVVMAVLIIGGLVAFNFYCSIAVDYPYNKQIGAHLNNAYDGSTPEIMKENLLLAKNAMIKAGLKPENYGKIFFWEQTADYQMEYTYRYIDGLINRTDYIIAWRDSHIGSDAPVLQDVYNEMLDDLRVEYKRNGPIDWAAKDAWMIKNHNWVMFSGYAAVVYIIALTTLMIYFIYRIFDDLPYSLRSYNSKHGVDTE